MKLNSVTNRGAAPSLVKLYEGNSPTSIENNIISSMSQCVELCESIENFSSILILQVAYTNSSSYNSSTEKYAKSTLSQTMPVDFLKNSYGVSCIEMSECNPTTQYKNSAYYLSVHLRSAWGFLDGIHLAQTWQTSGSGLWPHNTDYLYVYGIR